MIQSTINQATRLGVNILLLLAAGLTLHWCHSVFIPMIIALLLACVLGPSAVWLHQRLRIRWGLACITVIFGLVLLNLLATLVLSISVLGQVSNLDAAKVQETFEHFGKKVNEISPMPIEVPTDDQIRQFIAKVGPVILEQAGILGMEWLFKWFFILFLLFFLLLEGPTLARRVIDIFGPSEALKSKAKVVLLETAQQIRTYIVWRTLINVGLAIVIGVAFHVGGLKQAWTWAILLAILNYIPYLGPFLAGVPPLVDAFVHTSFPALTALFIIYWAVIILEGYLIVPLVMGRSMDLNATTVMVACLFWELVWGMSGLFLAMPIMAGVKSACYHVPGWWQWANLMSSDELTPPSDPPATTGAAA